MTTDFEVPPKTPVEVPSITPVIDELVQAIEELKVTAQENPAVRKCSRAFLLLYARARARGDSDAEAESQGRRAYRLSMPPLTGNRNVRNFIACATHGMLIGAIDVKEATRLLYAAQVAHTSRRSRSKNLKDRPGTTSATT